MSGDNKNDKKDGNGREPTIKEPPEKQDDGLVVEVVLPPKKPDEGPKH